MILSKPLWFSFWVSIVFVLSVRSAWPDNQSAVDTQVNLNRSNTMFGNVRLSFSLIPSNHNTNVYASSCFGIGSI